MKPDLLICWIKHTDYPIFRRLLRKYRDFFGDIIVYFSEHNKYPYFDHFMHDAMAKDGVKFIDSESTNWSTLDWRNVATNKMLEYSTSEWVCSVEQDWFCKDWDEILGKVEEKSRDFPLLGWAGKSGAKSYYIHPAFFFIRRDVLEKTRKDFAAKDGEDHFGHITRDAEALGIKSWDLESEYNCQVSEDADCFHLGGVNQNYLSSDEPRYVFHRPEPFAVYNYWCRKTDIEQSPKFAAESFRVEKMLKELHPALNLEENGWTKFFKV